MKKRTIVIVAFSAVLAVGWLGMTIGVRIGTEFGMADYHSQYVRELQIDLGDAVQKSDPHTKKVLGHVSDLVAAMGQPEKFRKAHEVFAKEIEDLQNKARLDNPH
jgi:hypothetical protein